MKYFYIYRVVREDENGKQGKRTRLYSSYEPLNVGGLYAHLGRGFPGLQRVLELVKKEEL